MTFSFRKEIEPLEALWDASGHDWELNISASLTEPTCPTAVIQPEGWNITRYRVDMDSIEESLAKAVALVRQEVIERKVVGSYCPFSNPDDDDFAKWLHARAKGSDERLPYKE